MIGIDVAATPTVQDDGQVRRNAVRAWAEMQHAEVLPTPGNFELWFVHLSGQNPVLSERLTALLAKCAIPPAAQLQALHEEFLEARIPPETMSDQADQIDQEARAVADHIAGHQAGLTKYGATLFDMSEQIVQDRTFGGLAQAVQILTVETTRASERNRSLEQRLSASAARIARLRRELQATKQEATTDGLTGLCNRKALDKRLRRAITNSKTDNESLSVVLLDIDHFKQFNDLYGHSTGDLVLRLVGRIISNNVKGRDTAARYGGEEFAVVLSGANLKGASIVAGQIRVAIEGKQLTTHGRKQISGLTVSAGVAQLQEGDTVLSILERADAALYQAKHLGRNRVCLSEL